MRRLLRLSAWGCGGTLLLFVLLIVGLFVLLNRVPSSYPASDRPIGPPGRGDARFYGLDGFESPYLGHNGSWDGQGGALFGGSKVPDLDREVAMGLRWTFMPVYWCRLEPGGPVNPAGPVPAPPAWRELDAFVAEAHARKLNVLMQPTIGGNAGGPPAWAGRRERGKSAPADMEAAAAFCGKLAARYAPGGTLAREKGWGETYGVRAWELDNEPNAYLTHWGDQAADYAEFATRSAARIRAADPRAVIVLPATTGGGDARDWVRAALGAPASDDVPAARRSAFDRDSIGPAADVVSFHNYEGADSAFAGGPRTIEVVLGEIRDAFESMEAGVPGQHYLRKRDYWHTEGNFDFIGALSEARRAAWRGQFFTRAFAAGMRKVCVMDAKGAEQAAVAAYVRVLPWPFPMRPAGDEATVVAGQATVFVHDDGDADDAGRVWVAWAVAGAGSARVDVPVRHKRVALVDVAGKTTVVEARGQRVEIGLTGDAKMAPPVLIVDRPGSEAP